MVRTDIYIGETKGTIPDANGDVREEFNREGIGVENLGLFTLLKGRVGTIWITGNHQSPETSTEKSHPQIRRDCLHMGRKWKEGRLSAR